MSNFASSYGAQDYLNDQERHYGFNRRVNDESLEESSSENTPDLQCVDTIATIKSVFKRKPVPEAAPKPIPEAGAPVQEDYETPEFPRHISEGPRRKSQFNEEGLSGLEKSRYPPRKPVGTVRPSVPAAAVPTAERTTSGYFKGMSRAKTNAQADTVPSSEPSRPRTKRSDSLNSVKSLASSVGGSVANRVRGFSNSVKEMTDVIKMDRSERVEYRRSKCDSLPGSPSRLNLNQFESTTQLVQPDTPTKPRPGSLKTGEKLALSVSMMADTIKNRGRSGTNDSDMSMGMTDKAPAGTMNSCMGCYAPCHYVLKKGLCERCYADELEVTGEKTKDGDEDEELFTDPWQSAQGRSTWPEVQSSMDDYIRLPNRRKLIRIRKTIYEDPGNPFADEIEEPDERPPTLWFSSSRSADRMEAGDERPLTSWFSPQKPPQSADKVDEPPPESWFSHGESYPRPDVDDYPSSRSSSEYGERRVQSMPKTSKGSLAFMGGNLKLPHQNSSAATKMSHRRSKSVAVSSVLSPTDATADYIPPRQFWRQGSAPVVTVKQLDSKDGKDVRDTKFYGFYDDVLSKYKGRDSRL